jgi:VanZ family protein
MQNTVPYSTGELPEWRGGSSFKRRLWAYGPLVLWLGFIFLASTDLLSATHTGSTLRAVLMWLFPGISASTVNTVHFLVRKAGHFSEYGVLALLAARAFYLTPSTILNRHWFLCSLCLVAGYALTDEYHQSFVPTRTASIYDSMIDTAGGVTVLIVLYLVGRMRLRGNGEVGKWGRGKAAGASHPSRP